MRPVQNGQGHGYGVDQVAGCGSSLGRQMLSLARNLRRESLVGEAADEGQTDISELRKIKTSCQVWCRPRYRPKTVP
jgi:hypothetical protein